MCMEDVKLGRETQPVYTTVTAGTTAAQLVEGSGARWSLVIGPPSSGVIWVLPGYTVKAGQGFCLASGDPPLRFEVSDDGQMVMEPWFVIADAGAPIVPVVATRLLRGSEYTPNPAGGQT